MTKWDKKKFIKKTKSDCMSHVSMITMDLIKFAEDNADQIVWGSGDQFGTMTFKCKSHDYGFLPLFYITTNGRIKLRQLAEDAQYVWVTLNGELLAPSVDYKVTNDQMFIKINQNA